MIVKVYLQQRKLVSADLDQERCSLSDAVVLLAHYIININHPKMHAYANWGIDPEADTGYLQKMSVVTACYNHYGYTNFPQMANNMVRKGAGACFGICLRESLKSGVKTPRAGRSVGPILEAHRLYRALASALQASL